MDATNCFKAEFADQSDVSLLGQRIGPVPNLVERPLTFAAPSLRFRIVWIVLRLEEPQGPFLLKNEVGANKSPADLAMSPAL